MGGGRGSEHGHALPRIYNWREIGRDLHPGKSMLQTAEMPFPRENLGVLRQNLEIKNSAVSEGLKSGPPHCRCAIPNLKAIGVTQANENDLVDGQLCLKAASVPLSGLTCSHGKTLVLQASQACTRPRFGLSFECNWNGPG